MKFPNTTVKLIFQDITSSFLITSSFRMTKILHVKQGQLKLDDSDSYSRRGIHSTICKIIVQPHPESMFLAISLCQ